MSEATGAFDGLRVVDASERLAGAYAARLFADEGADVVLAEPPSGHPLRHRPPFLEGIAGPDRSLVHAYANWNKRSVVAADDGALAELLAGCDVVVTTGRRLDVPDGVIHLSVTPHGLSGPLAGVPGEHLTACARTGWMPMNAFAGEPPVQLPEEVSGVLAGLVAFAVGAACVLEGAQHGFARAVDVSELEVLMLTTAPWATASVYRGEDTDGGPGGRRARGRPGPLYDARDGRICLGFGEWRDWPGAMRLLRLDELSEDPLLVPTFGRHQQDLAPVGAGAARTVPDLDRWPLFRALGAMRCGSGCVQDMADLLGDEQFAARAFLTATTVAGRRVRAPSSPYHSTASSGRPPRPAPRLAEGGVAPPRRRPQAPPRPGPAPAAGPLAGTRVLTFTQAWSGTLGTELLAFLGADVVQIELLQRSDIWRNAASGIPAGIADPDRRQVPQNVQGLYNSVNLDKRAIALDMASERGRELFWRLVPRFDVVAENFAPHVTSSWGITMETLAAARPDVVFASLSGYGRGGPYTDFPANGSTIEPMSGLSSLNGAAGGPGENTGGLLPDPTAAMAFAAGIVAALAERRRCGRPQRVDVAMTEAMASTFGDAVMDADAGGAVRGPQGNASAWMAPHGCYPAADGRWIAIAVATDEQWVSLRDELAPHLDALAALGSVAVRRRAGDALDAAIAAATSTRGADALADALTARGVAAAVVVRLTDVVRRPAAHLVERGFWVDVDHPEAGRSTLAGRPWRLDGVAQPPLRAAPCVGQHSEQILREELGFDADAYAALVRGGITGVL